MRPTNKRRQSPNETWGTSYRNIYFLNYSYVKGTAMKLITSIDELDTYISELPTEEHRIIFDNYTDWLLAVRYLQLHDFNWPHPVVDGDLDWVNPNFFETERFQLFLLSTDDNTTTTPTTMRWGTVATEAQVGHFEPACTGFAHLPWSHSVNGDLDQAFVSTLNLARSSATLRHKPLRFERFDLPLDNLDKSKAYWARYKDVPTYYIIMYNNDLDRWVMPGYSSPISTPQFIAEIPTPT